MFLLKRGEFRRGFNCLTRPGRSFVNFLAISRGFRLALTHLRNVIRSALDSGPLVVTKSQKSSSVASEVTD